MTNLNYTTYVELKLYHLCRTELYHLFRTELCHLYRTELYHLCRNRLCLWDLSAYLFVAIPAKSDNLNRHFQDDNPDIQTDNTSILT